MMSGPVLRTGHSPAAQARSRAFARAARMAPSRTASTESTTRLAVGVDATGAEESRLIAQHRQVGETVAAVGQGERHVEQDPARIVTPLPMHRRRQASLSALVRPTKSAISASSRVPAWAATPLPSAVTDNGGRALLRFTLEVPFSRGSLLFRSYQVSQR